MAKTRYQTFINHINQFFDFFYRFVSYLFISKAIPVYILDNNRFVDISSVNK